MKKLCQEYSTAENIEFAKDVLETRLVLNKAKAIKDQAIVSAKTPGYLYFARKVIAGKLGYEQQQRSINNNISHPITPKDTQEPLSVLQNSQHFKKGV